jgi:hypothetical protein
MYTRRFRIACMHAVTTSVQCGGAQTPEVVSLPIDVKPIAVTSMIVHQAHSMQYLLLQQVWS